MHHHPTIIFVLLLATAPSFGQSINSGVPKSVKTSDRYLFYLHGAIVQQMGENAVSEVYGKYEYRRILDTLARYQLHVISEVRPKDSETKKYAAKVSSQIDDLLRRGVPPGNITVVGASLGAHMTIEVAQLQKNSEINYVVLGLCSDYTTKAFASYKDKLCGNFLSIYEKSDRMGSCNDLLKAMKCKTGYKEVMLNMGNSHGFLYKPYDNWVHPLMKWLLGR